MHLSLSSSFPSHRPLVMGIVNITPDSFSDGGLWNTPQGLKERVHELGQNGVGIIDIGAESTAPFNPSLSYQEEKLRLENTLFPFLQKNPWPQGILLSLDTYHIETFLHVYSFVQKLPTKIRLFWNDVSGQLDKDVLTILQKNCRDCWYVYAHTFVPSRDMTGKHMSFLSMAQGEDFLDLLKEHFLRGREILQRFSCEERVFFDPCFGFSKSREQNLFLIQHLSCLIQCFPTSQKWLLGISRKSFLRGPESKNDRSQTTLEQTERLHTFILAKWLKELPQFPLVFRVHDPRVVQLSVRIAQEFSILPSK